MNNKKAVIIMLVFLSIVLLSLELYFFNYTVDDNYEGFRFSKNLVKGYGLNFNPLNEGDKPFESYSNFLSIFISAIGVKLGNVELWIKLFNMFFSILSLFGLYKLANLIIKDKFYSLLPPLFLAITLPFAIAAVNGFETVFFTFLLIMAFYFYIKEESNYNLFPISAIFFLIMALLKIEGAIPFAVAFIFRSYKLYKEKFVNIKMYITWLLLFSVIYLTYFGWRLWYYGNLFPNPVYTKSLPLGGLGYIFTFFSFILPFIILGIFSFNKKLDFIKIFLFSIILFRILSIINIDPIMGEYYRFFIPILPIFYLFAADGLKEINLNKFYITILVLVLIVFLLNPISFKNMRLETNAYVQNMHVYKEVGIWLKDNVPENSLLVVDLGIVPYYSELPTITPWGLHDKYLAHNGTDLNYILSKKPEVFVLFRDINKYNPGSFKENMYEFHTLNKREDFQRDYSLVKTFETYNKGGLSIYRRINNETS